MFKQIGLLLGAAVLLSVLVSTVQRVATAMVGAEHWLQRAPDLGVALFTMAVLVVLLKYAPAVVAWIMQVYEPEPDPVQEEVDKYQEDVKSLTASVLVNIQQATDRKDGSKQILQDTKVLADTLANVVVGIARQVTHYDKQARLLDEIVEELIKPEPNTAFIAYLCGKLANSRFSIMAGADITRTSGYWPDVIKALMQYKGTLEKFRDSYVVLGQGTLKHLLNLEQGFEQLKLLNAVSTVALPVYKVDAQLIASREQLQLALRAPQPEETTEQVLALTE